MKKRANNTNTVTVPALDQSSQIAAIVAAVLAQMNGGNVAPSVPTPAKAARKQASVMSGIYPEVPRAVHVAAANARPASVKTKAPDGLTAHVGEGKWSQVKLPSALFANFSRIVLVFADGTEKAVEEDSEGRARLQVKQACELSGAHVGQYLRFEETNAGYFAVSVVSGIATNAASTNGASKQVAVPMPKGHPVSKFAGLFGATSQTAKAASKAAPAAPTKRKRTPAQIAATERMLAAKAAKQAARESGVIVDANTKRTPRYVAPEVTPKGARGVPVPNVGASQTAFANGQKAQTKADTIINAITGKGAAYTVPSRKR